MFIPLTVGGGINEVGDFERVLSCGADKVSVNSGAIKDPSLIDRAAKRYGDQCVVLSMDVKRVDGQFRIFAKGGRVDTGIDALQWAHDGQERGAGELVVNSIDTDGVKQGFDLEMLSAMARQVTIPIIASGGAGKMEDFKTLFEAVPQVDAGLAASISQRAPGRKAAQAFLRLTQKLPVLNGSVHSLGGALQGLGIPSERRAARRVSYTFINNRRKIEALNRFEIRREGFDPRYGAGLLFQQVLTVHI